MPPKFERKVAPPLTAPTPAPIQNKAAPAVAQPALSYQRKAGPVHTPPAAPEAKDYPAGRDAERDLDKLEEALEAGPGNSRGLTFRDIAEMAQEIADAQPDNDRAQELVDRVRGMLGD
jgi:hypothetical protein